jgi:SAM-dependent methyltransferase
MGGDLVGRLSDEVPALYDRVRPGYPDELFADLATITGVDEKATVLEVGCGTGQATRSLARLGGSVTAVERGPGWPHWRGNGSPTSPRRDRDVDVRGVGRPQAALRPPGGRVVRRG